MTLSPANVVQLVFAFHAAFFAVFVLGRERQRALPMLLLVFAAHMGASLVEEAAGAPFHDCGIIGLAPGPLLYFLSRELIEVGHFPRLRDIAHFLPVLLVLPLSPVSSVTRGVALVSLLVYLPLTVYGLRRHHRITRDTRSDAEAITLRW